MNSSTVLSNKYNKGNQPFNEKESEIRDQFKANLMPLKDCADEFLKTNHHLVEIAESIQDENNPCYRNAQEVKFFIKKIRKHAHSLERLIKQAENVVCMNELDQLVSEFNSYRLQLKKTNYQSIIEQNSEFVSLYAYIVNDQLNQLSELLDKTKKKSEIFFKAILLACQYSRITLLKYLFEFADVAFLAESRKNVLSHYFRCLTHAVEKKYSDEIIVCLAACCLKSIDCYRDHEQSYIEFCNSGILMSSLITDVEEGNIDAIQKKDLGKNNCILIESLINHADLHHQSAVIGYLLCRLLDYYASQLLLPHFNQDLYQKSFFNHTKKLLQHNDINNYLMLINYALNSTLEITFICDNLVSSFADFGIGNDIKTEFFKMLIDMNHPLLSMDQIWLSWFASVKKSQDLVVEIWLFERVHLFAFAANDIECIANHIIDRRNEKILEIAMQYFFKIDFRFPSGQTFFLKACEAGYVEMMSKLINASNGVCLQDRDKKNNHAVHYVKRSKNSKANHFLKKQLQKNKKSQLTTNHILSSKAPIIEKEKIMTQINLLLEEAQSLRDPAFYGKVIGTNKPVLPSLNKNIGEEIDKHITDLKALKDESENATDQNTLIELQQKIHRINLRMKELLAQLERLKRHVTNQQLRSIETKKSSHHLPQMPILQHQTQDKKVTEATERTVTPLIKGEKSAKNVDKNTTLTAKQRRRQRRKQERLEEQQRLSAISPAASYQAGDDREHPVMVYNHKNSNNHNNQKKNTSVTQCQETMFSQLKPQTKKQPLAKNIHQLFTLLDQYLENIFPAQEQVTLVKTPVADQAFLYQIEKLCEFCQRNAAGQEAYILNSLRNVICHHQQLISANEGVYEFVAIFKMEYKKLAESKATPLVKCTQSLLAAINASTFIQNALCEYHILKKAQKEREAAQCEATRVIELSQFVLAKVDEADAKRALIADIDLLLAIFKEKILPQAKKMDDLTNAFDHLSQMEPSLFYQIEFIMQSMNEHLKHLKLDVDRSDLNSLRNCIAHELGSLEINYMRIFFTHTLPRLLGHLLELNIISSDGLIHDFMAHHSLDAEQKMLSC